MIISIFYKKFAFAVFTARALSPLLVLGLFFTALNPAAWGQSGQSTYVVPTGLVKGGQFIDRFLPMKPNGPLRSDVWGADAVKPRDVNTGVEDSKYSYWCTSVVKGPDGKYHDFVVRWPENSPKGHFEWPNSNVVQAIGPTPTGPFKIVQEIGKGHNVTAYQAKDGTWILYVIGGCYRGPTLYGPWTRGTLSFDTRGREDVDMTNCTFAQRSDGSYLMINRTGQVWISKDGDKEPFQRISNRAAYPPVRDARFEDPVVWKDDVQYNLIVNDWFGRAAYYLRSRDGLHWDWDQGLAYAPGIFKHEDGKVENWYKIERPRVVQDERGRADYMLFAVIDVPKEEDKLNDNHSSKAIAVGIVPPRTVMVRKQGGNFLVGLAPDKDFNPVTDVNPSSLRFGAPSAVDFGKAAAPLRIGVEGKLLVAEFAGKDCGFQAADSTAKLLGSDRKGGLVFGYVPMPGEPAEYPLLSADGKAEAGGILGGVRPLTVTVENFGLAKSLATTVQLVVHADGKPPGTFTAPLPALAPYETGTAKFRVPADLAPSGSAPQVEITIGGQSADDALKTNLPKLP